MKFQLPGYGRQVVRVTAAADKVLGSFVVPGPPTTKASERIEKYGVSDL
jgi:hypothetical protein